MSQTDLFSAEVAPVPHTSAEAGTRGIPTASRARATDPKTSKDAAEAIVPVLGAQCERVLAALVEIERTNASDRIGATVSELAMRLAYGNEPAPQRNIISRRLTDLEQAGLVEVYVDDAGPLTRMANTGRFQQVWHVIR